MVANIKRYFAGGNTFKGFYSLYESALANLGRIFIIKGGPGTGKSTIMRNISLELTDRGYDVEHLHCSSDPNSLDGVIVRELSIGIVDGTAPHVIEPVNPGIVEEIINLGDCWDRNKLLPYKGEIEKITSLIKEQFAKAYDIFAEAKVVKDEIKKQFIDDMDYKDVDRVTQQLIADLFKNYQPPYVRQLFFGANSPEGFVEYIDNITKNIEKRYILKGVPGAGKSTMLAKIAQKAEEIRFDVEVYRCALNPDDIDIVIIPPLGIAVIDAGNNSYDIDIRKSDTIIDLTKGLNGEFINKVSAKTKQLQLKYDELMTAGTNRIAQAKQLHQEKERFYIEAMDFEKVNDKKLAILKEILLEEKR
ncbi:PRK06851 family protein [Desulfuribacillus alkaliarsenatis]|uniref:ATPase n=1 Tax=Desulfuribacillus alkaliarsenatis TaxID=766136 RepID=A0A1E5G5R6_9FIRM|nr:PRK06851 family protein [Desulfuribacillus alkaliarsenatis]OEF98508.1 hypothetical protein BHF68_02210 [Desulfuribacillus alkaliarsenatis]